MWFYFLPGVMHAIKQTPHARPSQRWRFEVVGARGGHPDGDPGLLSASMVSFLPGVMNAFGQTPHAPLVSALARRGRGERGEHPDADPG
eukprot:15668543-Heterocapsa_arctica.AAC.2